MLSNVFDLQNRVTLASDVSGCASGGEMPPVISIQGLTKRYGRLMALNNLTLDVCEGETFGFLGLNGAGKTTAIRLLLDLLRPSSGQAFIFGRNCWTEGLRVREQLG